MGKVEPLFPRVKSLKTSFAIYIIVCLLAAVLLLVISSLLCQYGQDRIYSKYQEQYISEMRKSGKMVFEDGQEQELPIGVYSGDIRVFYSDTELIIDQTLSFLNVALVPVYFVFCISATSVLFYKRKLKKPLEILDNAADNIAKSNLDFTIEYKSSDEMGKLCASFEKMRSALEKNNSEMWRLMEERKRLNAAFSHDLRTPLTVLKGHTDILCKYVPQGKISEEKILQTSQTMAENILRLESYVNGMSKLQKLEDTEAIPKFLDVARLIKELKETAVMICGEKELSFSEKCEVSGINADEQIILRVYENLLSNASRYARRKIDIRFAAKSGSFSVTVSDDGGGFDSDGLVKATNPFYRAKECSNGSHFGLGLNICKILCEKHGGGISISNNAIGGCVTAVFRTS